MEQTADVALLAGLPDAARDRAFAVAVRIAAALGVPWEDVSPDDRIRAAAEVARLIPGESR